MSILTFEQTAAKVGLKPEELEKRLNLPEDNPKKITLLYYADEEEKTFYQCVVDEYLKHSEARQGQSAILSDDELSYLFVSLKREKGANWKAALVAISNYAGLRVGEIAKLTINHVWKNESVRLTGQLMRSETKRKKPRVIFLKNQKLREILSLHIQDRFNQGADIGSPLFIGERTGEAYSRHRLAAVFKKIYVDAGFDGCSSHSGRRRAATRMFRQGKSIKLIMQLMGHSSAITTSIYDNVTEDDVLEAQEDL